MYKLPQSTKELPEIRCNQDLLRIFDIKPITKLLPQDSSHLIKDLPGKQNASSGGNFEVEIFEPLRGNVQKIEEFDLETLESAFVVSNTPVSGFDSSLFDDYEPAKEVIQPTSLTSIKLKIGDFDIGAVKKPKKNKHKKHKSSHEGIIDIN